MLNILLMVWQRPDQPLHVRWNWRIEDRTCILTQARNLTAIKSLRNKKKTAILTPLPQEKVGLPHPRWEKTKAIKPPIRSQKKAVDGGKAVRLNVCAREKSSVKTTHSCEECLTWAHAVCANYLIRAFVCGMCKYYLTWAFAVWADYVTLACVWIVCK
jgi:hypothetical protein